MLSGNGLRIADGVALAIPIIGSYVSYGLFGGEFPGIDIVPRLFTVHILLVPALIVALVTVHLILMVVHKHTQYPGPGRSDNNVVGYPAFPVYVAKMAGFFFIVFGFLALMGTFLSINNVWNYGPYDPSPVSAGAQPDWYMLFLEGSLRLMPGWEVVHRRLHAVAEHPHPRRRGAGPALRPARAVPVHRGRRDARQARAPRARPAAQRPGPHRHRRRDHHRVPHPRRGRLQRPHRHALPPVDQRHHVDVPGAVLRRAR